MSALRELLVVDCTSDVGGAYAGKLLADLGARVVIVEPPGGNPLRKRGVVFAHLSGGKQSFVGDPSELLAAADIVLTDGTMDVSSDAVVVDLSPFGRTGPYASWKGSDIATWALGGYLYLCGDKARAPLKLPGSQAELHLGAHAAFAALAGVRAGIGQRIEVSALDAVLAAHIWLVSSWLASGTFLDRTTDDLVPCKDGHVHLMRLAPNPNIFILVDKPELLENPPPWGPQVFELLAEWAKDHTKDEITELAQELRIAITPVRDAREVRNDPQLEARDWWEREDGFAFPGQPFKFGATPSKRRGPAPKLGEHTDAIRAETLDRARPSVAVRDAPLEGVRIVEVTTNWAGPVCGRHLGDLGADIVKVEWATRPATRALVWPGIGPFGDWGNQSHNRSLYFNEMNRNKRDLVIDLSTDGGKEVFLELIRRADVLVENNSARVMPNLGLGWDELKQVNPKLVMVSMAGYGGSGPLRDWVAYGSNIETTSGLVSATGYGDGSVYRSGVFYADPVSGVHGAVAVLAALEHVRRTGEGQWVDISLNECGAAFTHEVLLEYELTGEVPEARANRDPRFAPQGVYRCAGNDNWVALSVQSDDDWAAFAPLIGMGSLSFDERSKQHDAIDEAISAWTATREQYQVARELQRLGISAAPVLANWQMLADPHIAARGFYQPVEHPVLGVYPTTSWPWRFSRTPAKVYRPAPLFGEHTREILAELGFDPEPLYEAGVTSDTPAPLTLSS